MTGVAKIIDEANKKIQSDLNGKLSACCMDSDEDRETVAVAMIEVVMLAIAEVQDLYDSLHSAY